MKNGIIFKTTRLPEYKRGVVWYLSALATAFTLLSYFVFIDYSPISATCIGIGIFVYYFFVFRPENPLMTVAISEDGIQVRSHSIPYEECLSFSRLPQKTGRPALIILSTPKSDFSIPLPEDLSISEVSDFLNGKVSYREKVPFIHSLCHTLKI